MVAEKPETSYVHSIVQKMFGHKDAPGETIISSLEQKTNLRRDQVSNKRVGIS